MNGPINLFVLSCPCLPATLHIQRRQLKLLFPISSPHSTNERLRAGARSTFFLQWPFPFIVSDTNCIRVYILVFCVTLYRGFGCSRGRPAGKSVSQAWAAPGSRQPAGQKAGRDRVQADWLYRRVRASNLAKGFVSSLHRNVWLQAKDMLPSRQEK